MPPFQTDATFETLIFSVTFDAAKIGTAENPIRTLPSVLEVEQGDHIIRFDLGTVNSKPGEEAVFYIQEPIEWFFEDQPINRPPEFSNPAVEVPGTLLATLDSNQDPKGRLYGLKINLMFDGQLYTSKDPTILNLPPT
ncbi:MAG: hypothetical protein U0002_15035 [Thermoanaerobaculia bacterium]